MRHPFSKSRFLFIIIIGILVTGVIAQGSHRLNNNDSNNPSGEEFFFALDNSAYNNQSYWINDGEVRGVFAQGNFTFIADGSNGLRVLDTSNKSEPIEVGNYTEPSGIAHSVFVEGNFTKLDCGEKKQQTTSQRKAT